jgi:hypothetical protein
MEPSNVYDSTRRVLTFKCDMPESYSTFVNTFVTVCFHGTWGRVGEGGDFIFMENTLVCQWEPEARDFACNAFASSELFQDFSLSVN